ncbi:hypothetical protein MXB_2919 [Myxobolus squamalis]|nr:hypothetical protein MXB_2919 [Myxobolus squamalis]
MPYNNGMRRSISTVCALCVGASDRQIRIFLLRVYPQYVYFVNYIWIPRGSIVDFEIALLNYVKYKFTESIITGSSVVEENEKNFKYPNMNAKNFIQTNEELKHGNWLKFWNYFQKTLIEKLKPLLWNISSINECNLQGRTNNCLERYNRYLNELFANAHKNLVT